MKISFFRHSLLNRGGDKMATHKPAAQHRREIAGAHAHRRAHRVIAGDDHGESADEDEQQPGEKVPGSVCPGSDMRAKTLDLGREE